MSQLEELREWCQTAKRVRAEQAEGDELGRWPDSTAARARFLRGQQRAYEEVLFKLAMMIDEGEQ